MTKLEKILAENMRRFNTKNLSEQEAPITTANPDTIPFNQTTAISSAKNERVLLSFENDKKPIITIGTVNNKLAFDPTIDLCARTANLKGASLGKDLYLLIGMFGLLDTKTNSIKSAAPRAILINTSPSPDTYAPHKIVKNYNINTVTAAQMTYDAALIGYGRGTLASTVKILSPTLQMLFAQTTELGIQYNPKTFATDIQALGA